MPVCQSQAYACLSTHGQALFVNLRVCPVCHFQELCPVCQSQAYARLSTDGVCLFVNPGPSPVCQSQSQGKSKFSFIGSHPVRHFQGLLCLSFLGTLSCSPIPGVCLFVNPMRMHVCRSRAKPCLSIPGSALFVICRTSVLFVNPRRMSVCQSRANLCLSIPGPIQFCIY